MRLNRTYLADTTKITDLLNKEMERCGVPGITVAAINKGEIIMSDIINSAQNFQLSIKNDADLEKISNIGSALSSIDKLKILQNAEPKRLKVTEFAISHKTILQT